MKRNVFRHEQSLEKKKKKTNGRNKVGREGIAGMTKARQKKTLMLLLKNVS
jgi:hypothetical protein